MRLTPRQLRLYLVTDTALCAARGVAATVAEAVAGGVTAVQIRDKTATTAQRVALARAVRAALAGTGVPILINDDIEAALAADVAGVHVGQGDIAPAEARARLGPDRLLGLSCETAQHVRAVDPALVDYLGIGPVFATASKPDHARPIGFDGLAALAAQSPVPAVAIGGLGAAHAARCRAAGVAGPAVVSAICGQPDPRAAARAFFEETDA